MIKPRNTPVISAEPPIAAGGLAHGTPAVVHPGVARGPLQCCVEAGDLALAAGKARQPAPHSAYNRGLVVSVHDSLTLEVLPDSGRLAVEVDGPVAAHVDVGDRIELQPRPGAAHVVRLGRTTFYERARRKLRLTDSAEVPVSPS